MKALAARRLMNQRQVFFDITTSLFVYIVQLWNTHLQAAMEQLSAGNAESAVDTLNLACLCLKSEHSSKCNYSDLCPPFVAVVADDYHGFLVPPPAVLRQMIVHGFNKFHAIIEALVC